jgi:hypothetical protein
MSNLQLSLIAIGAALIGAVVIYNIVQERRARGRAEKAFRGEHADVLMDPTERREPTLGALPGATHPDPGLTPIGSVEDRMTPTVPPDEFEAPAGSDCVVSPRIDTVALVLADDPVTLESLEPLLDELQAHTTAVNVEGIVDEQWTPILGCERTSWRELRAGLQLASRNGPVDEEEIAAFNDEIARFAASINAVSQRESPAAAAARAVELDRFCAETDVEVVVNVIGRGGATFSISRVKALGLERGLSETADGALERRGADGSVAFVIRRFEREGAKQDATYATGLTFALDVPHVSDAPGTLAEMVALAQSFAMTFGGELVDDNRRPLSAQGLAAIRRSLEQVFQRMETHGIPAGGTLARRLFA